MNYRNEARRALARAEGELGSADDTRLRYAALELRMALECFVYERAEPYKEELSDEKLSTWQPKRLLDWLLEVDPTADKTSTLSFGEEEEYGKRPKEMKALGTERVLSLKEVKKYYARLGSYLHTPTKEQLAKGKVAVPAKIRSRCEEVANVVREILASPVFNVNVRSFAKVPCGRCETMIVRRVRPNSSALKASCRECGAPYVVEPVGDDQVDWKPCVQDVRCSRQGCTWTIELWDDELKVGVNWTCEECGQRSIIKRGVVPYEDGEVAKEDDDRS